MSYRRPLIAGNWKMNGTSSEADTLVGGILDYLGLRTTHEFDMIVCPPATLISKIVERSHGTWLQVGAQDCHAAEKGAHTGDISAPMLSDLGCRYVILGHSERRTEHGETSSQVAAKTSAVWAAHMVSIVCVGETEAERDAGRTLDVVGAQIRDSIPEGATAGNTVVAYEPVWAIGTGRTATAEEAQEVHAFIRRQLAQRFGVEAEGIRILYGGSMKPGNAAALIALLDVDGGLIGGASLNADDFWGISEACPKA